MMCSSVSQMSIKQTLWLGISKGFVKLIVQEFVFCNNQTALVKVSFVLRENSIYSATQ